MKDKLSKNITRCGKLLKHNHYLKSNLCTKMTTNLLSQYDYVKMSSTWGQSAWFNHIQFKPSETTRNAFYSLFSKSNNSFDHFAKWFVGITDGSGTFTISNNSQNHWTFCFKITQSKSNIQMLYHIKKVLQVGSIITSKNNIAEYILRNNNHIINTLLPIFDKYPLLTNKEFDYNQFHDAILIFNNSSISNMDKHYQIKNILNKQMPKNYVSSVWNNSSNLTLPFVNTIVSKQWLVGFTEVQGNFILVNTNDKHITQVFKINLKSNQIVINAIAMILNMNIFNDQNDYTCISSSDPQSIQTIIQYFNHTLKGIKSLEFKLWSRSFTKHLSYSQLQNLQNKIYRIWNKNKL
uniref:Homing endonuclease LAGLIDADG domain-containing protein n=1 Tax=Malassezia furfur TaxID=55194 RepID=A0A8K1I5G0_MALFU|nr:hypothetical protein [Malassezia furfur]